MKTKCCRLNQRTPTPRHRYHRNCQCEPCRHVRYTLMGINPRVQMTGQELQTLLNACHDYGTVHEGDFPNLEALLRAQAECRLLAIDRCSFGEILIVGPDACYVTFKVDD